jgi:hypothetical protein
MDIKYRRPFRWNSWTIWEIEWARIDVIRFCLNLLVTRFTNKFNVQQLYVLPTLYLYIL